MTGKDERREGRYGVPLKVAGPDAEPARRNGHHRTTAAAVDPPATTDEPDTAATDEPDTAATDEPDTAPTDEPDTAATDEPSVVADQPTGGPDPAPAEPVGTTPDDNGAVVPAGPAVPDRRDHWDRRVAGGLAFLRRRLSGDYEVDEFGFDPDLTDAVFHPLVRLLYRDWFRTEVGGLENVPADGPALVVGNHSGTVALDALILSAALHDQHPARRYLRLLGADLVFRMPVVSEIARKTGGTVACSPDAERLLGNGELVGVFPEGFKGVGKLYSDRYKLQRFGRGGFVSAALRTGTPIVPVAIVGGEEIYPMLADIKPLARLLKLPYFPVTPTFPWLGPLGMVPLPSKWLIEFCPPIPTAHLTDSADDPLVVFNLADQVRETIQQTLHRLLERRPDPFGP
ncbi:1-acyl-sn-glycerol-3-phosphate acyltransferase [Micromonospora inositola]|uniref:1-acyl-sn-glycerol-3-phosphate acyltransferase n=1 Tax=Micromonospora inositola TaxID=47865 RepID=A0A1C5I7K4_9ACTN|nr:1-acyl-sn-glycerol-3-phosphate acyltransferase [Micromonospora inositola]